MPDGGFFSGLGRSGTTDRRFRQRWVSPLLRRILLVNALPLALLVVALRAAVRSRSFWERGLASAWGDGTPPAWLRDAYRSPQLVSGRLVWVVCGCVCHGWRAQG